MTHQLFKKKNQNNQEPKIIFLCHAQPQYKQRKRNQEVSMAQSSTEVYWIQNIKQGNQTHSKAKKEETECWVIE